MKSDLEAALSEKNQQILDAMENARQLIRDNDSFVISTHVRPDSDAIGSVLGLARGLRQLRKDVLVVSQDGVPGTCKYLPDVDTIVTGTDRTDFDVAIICDANDLSRIGKSAEVLKRAKSLFVLDHHNMESKSINHISEDGFSESVYVVDDTMAASAELVWEFMEQIGVEIDPEMARQLMSGLVGDTGAFKFSNVKASTFAAAAYLTASGASPAEAAREIYENRPPKSARLLGVALMNAKYELDGKVALAHIRQEDFERYDASDSDTDGIVNQLIATKGVESAFLFRQFEPGNVRVSLRSRGGLDVNCIAMKFGGGGHAAASGCTIEMDPESAEKALLVEVLGCMAS